MGSFEKARNRPTKGFCVPTRYYPNINEKRYLVQKENYTVCSKDIATLEGILKQRGGELRMKKLKKIGSLKVLNEVNRPAVKSATKSGCGQCG